MKPISEYRTIRDLPARIPVFPLRGAILLPRARLPLNIFEPRYLAMIDEALATNRVVGIIQPQDTGADSPESPTGTDIPLKRIGCAGRLTSYQELDDGRMLISLTGLCRFKTLDEGTDDLPFRIYDVAYDEFEDDLQPDNGEHAVDRESLLRTLKLYLEANRFDADWDAITQAPTSLLVNSLSVISPFGAEEKQALLEAPDLKTRAEVLCTLAQMELATDDRSGGQVQ